MWQCGKWGYLAWCSRNCIHLTEHVTVLRCLFSHGMAANFSLPRWSPGDMLVPNFVVFATVSRRIARKHRASAVFISTGWWILKCLWYFFLLWWCYIFSWEDLRWLFRDLFVYLFHIRTIKRAFWNQTVLFATECHPSVICEFQSEEPRTTTCSLKPDRVTPNCRH